MANKKQTAQNPSTIKDPEQWVTGDEPMTGPQNSYIHTLAREAGEEVPEEMTKAEASEKIEELQEKTGRGTKAAPKPPDLTPQEGLMTRKRTSLSRNRARGERSPVAHHNEYRFASLDHQKAWRSVGHPRAPRKSLPLEQLRHSMCWMIFRQRQSGR